MSLWRRDTVEFALASKFLLMRSGAENYGDRTGVPIAACFPNEAAVRPQP